MWQSARECPVSPKRFSETSFCPPSVLLIALPIFSPKQHDLNETKKKEEQKKKALDIQWPDIMLIAEYLPQGRRQKKKKKRKHQKPSAKKENGYKAVVFVGMKCIDTHQLSSCKIIAQSWLLKRHGWRVQEEMGEEAFRSCHSEKSSSIAKNNVCL